jgi:hypothetical protein
MDLRLEDDLKILKLEYLTQKLNITATTHRIFFKF